MAVSKPREVDRERGREWERKREREKLLATNWKHILPSNYLNTILTAIERQTRHRRSKAEGAQ